MRIRRASFRDFHDRHGLGLAVALQRAHACAHEFRHGFEVARLGGSRTLDFGLEHQCLAIAQDPEFFCVADRCETCLLYTSDAADE